MLFITKMVQTRRKTVRKANPLVSGRIGRVLDGHRQRRRLAIKAIAGHHKRGARACTRTSALPILRASIYENSKWETPPDYKMTSEESPPSRATTRHQNHQRGSKPNCLVFTKHQKILYPDFFFCNSCNNYELEVGIDLSQKFEGIQKTKCEGNH